MYADLSTKTKLFINMILTQVAFAAISIVAILTSSDIVAIIIINVVFTVIVAWTSYAAMKRITGGINRFKKYFDDIIDFTFMRTNGIEKAKYMKKDEIGLILEEMNTYVDSIDGIRKGDMKVLGEVVLILNKVEQGSFNCRVKSDSQNFMIHALREAINKMLDNLEDSITSIKNISNSYANNDFTNKIEISPILRADMLEVMQSVNKLGVALGDSARSNLNNGQSLEQNASYMKNSMNNLAEKANEQAASLEETSATVEEITSLTRNNAQNAAKMAELGTSVKAAVTSGQELATQTASSMEEINEKVTSINEAITVIDQIAFQTNILSLNAAVEAATAGEAGKGFAVVAQEVRNLAARSAEAAKEIKELVEDANTKANEGKTISSKMISGYENLNTQISETIHIIEDVSSASKEQMNGIEQINDAVTMLDRVTQENASEANQITSISNEVSNMANELVIDAQNKKFN